jgi:hypothetical protein
MIDWYLIRNLGQRAKERLPTKRMSKSGSK